MKITAVLGSGREDSRSNRVARQVIAGARSAGHEVKIYELGGVPLIGCEGCGRCRRDQTDCVLQDVLTPYWQDLRESEVLIAAAPNYNSQPCGTMITFLNRHYCLLTADKRPRLDHDVRLISIFAQGAENKKLYESNYRWYTGCFATKRIVDTDMLVIGGDTDLSEDGSAMKGAFQLGAKL